MLSLFSAEHSDPWASDFVDVAALNAPVSDAIAAHIEQIRMQAPLGPSGLRSSSLLVLGPAGSGKTHLFARLRKRFGARAGFVLVRPELGLSMTPRHMLSAILDSLHRRCHGLDTRQLDAAVGALLAVLGDGDQRYPMTYLDDLQRDDVRRAALIERVTASLEERYDEVHSGYLARLLAFPFASRVDRRGLLAWLSGRELEDGQLRRLGLPGAIPDQDVLPALRTLSIAAAFGAPVVVVFDQLENLVGEGDDAERVHTHANLVSELFDSVRGLVLVQMALDAEWTRRIRPMLSESQRDRLEARILNLELPRPDEREALLGAWTEAIPSSERKGYFPWPFDEPTWTSWRTAPGVTPRALMVACREAFEGRSPAIPGSSESVDRDALHDRLEAQWATYVQDARQQLEEAVGQKRGLDKECIVAALLRAARLLGAKAVAQPARKPGDLVLESEGQSALVFVVQQPNARSVASALTKAVSAAESGRVVLVRERRLSFPPTWKSITQPLEQLDRAPNALWLHLDEEQVVHLLAVHDFLSSARSRDITDERGEPVEEQTVQAWLAGRAQEAPWTVVKDLITMEKAAGPESPLPPERATHRGEEPQAPTGWHDVTDGPAMRTLRELRVASVERIVREVRASHAGLSRAAVVEELRSSRQAGWAGASVVFMREDGP
jgi:hypothetical protein